MFDSGEVLGFPALASLSSLGIYHACFALFACYDFLEKLTVQYSIWLNDAVWEMGYRLDCCPLIFLFYYYLFFFFIEFFFVKRSSSISPFASNVT